MADLSDSKSGKILYVRMSGASVTKTAELFGVTWSTVSKVMTAFEKKRPPYRSKTLKESESCLIGTVGLLRGLSGRSSENYSRA